MKSNVITIMKKELARFFSNKTSAAIAILLPGVLLYSMWSIMGSAFEDLTSADNDKSMQIAAVYFPESLRGATEAAGIEIVDIDSTSNTHSFESGIKDGSFDIYVFFPDDFDQVVGQLGQRADGDVPQVEIFYDSTEARSIAAYTAMTSILDAYESSLNNLFNVNAGDQEYDVSDSQSRSAQYLVSFIPMLLLILLFSSCMSIAAESIAGEKERGTMATLLASPIKRSDIALGKILALALIGLMAAASSTIGIFASLPNLSQGEIDINIYGPPEYGLLALVIVSTTLLIVMLIAVVSALAKTTKEAQLYLTPLMIVVMVIGLLGMFGTGAKPEFYFYLIPLYNSVQCMIGIFSFGFEPINVVLCVASNIVYTGIGVYFLQKMFKSERLMFAR